MRDTKLGSNLGNRPVGGALSREFGVSVKEDTLKSKLKRALDILEARKNSPLQQKRTRDKTQPVSHKFVGWRRR